MIPSAHLQAALHVLGLRGETALYAISGNCMAPLLREGDSLLIRYGNDDIRVGDVVVFGSPGDLCVHRVVSVGSREGLETFIVKGDLCADVRPPISRDEILGKVIEVHGSNGHIRFESPFWRSVNHLLWLRSHVSVRRLQSDTVLWKATNAIVLLRARFFPGQCSISLLPIRAMCWFKKVWPDTARSHPGSKGRDRQLDETRPLRKEEIVCQKLGDEWILYDLEPGSIHIINAMAEFVWRMCDGCHSIEEMERQIADAYEVPGGMNVRADVQSVIQSFADLGMLASQEA